MRGAAHGLRRPRPFLRLSATWPPSPPSFCYSVSPLRPLRTAHSIRFRKFRKWLNTQHQQHKSGFHGDRSSCSCAHLPAHPAKLASLKNHTNHRPQSSVVVVVLGASFLRTTLGVTNGASAPAHPIHWRTAPHTDRLNLFCALIAPPLSRQSLQASNATRSRSVTVHNNPPPRENQIARSHGFQRVPNGL